MALEGLRRIHAAFYAENRDVTNPDELVAVAVSMGFDADEFRVNLASEEATREVRQDFALARKVGVQGFPTMLASAGAGREYAIVAAGYRDATAVLSALRRWRAVIEA